MKNPGPLVLALVASAVAACASAPRDEAPRHERAVFERVTVEQVRRAAVEAVGGVSRFMEPARVTEDGRVVGEYAIADWTRYEVRFDEVPAGVAVEVLVDREPSCGTIPARSARPRSEIQQGDAVIPLEGGGYEVVRAPVATGETTAGREVCWRRDDTTERERRLLARIGDLLRHEPAALP